MKSRVAVIFLMAGVLNANAEDRFINVSGFVDPQFHQASNRGSTQGFVIQDAAVILSKKVSGATFQLDLPFSGASFGFNSLKSQAFAAYQQSDHFFWKLGKFDAPIGVEANKATQIEMTRQGLTYALLPTSLTGVFFQFSLDSATSVTLIAADPTNAGFIGRGNYDFGARVDVGPENIRVWGIVLINADSTVRTVLDCGANFKWPELRADLGLSYFMTGILNYWSAIVKPVFQVSNAVDWGARLEYASAVVSDGSVTGPGVTIQGTFGPQWKWTDHLLLKVDYTITNSNPSEAESTLLHAGTLAAVLKM